MAQKKKFGPPLISVKAGDISTFPQRWLATLGYTRTTQKVPTDVVIDPLVTTLVESGVQQEMTDERKRDIFIIGNPSGVQLVGADFDKFTGGVLPYVEKIVAAGTTGSALSGTTYKEIQPLNSLWSLQTERTATTLTTNTYTKWEHVPFPRVLTTWTPYAFTDKLTTPDGPNILKAGVLIILTDYSGDYLVTVDEAWSDTPFNLASPGVFRPIPRSIVWDTPFGGGSVPECLHGDVTLDATTGTTHPVYAFIDASYDYPATNFTTVVGVRIIGDTQERFNGGWLRQTKTVTVT